MRIANSRNAGPHSVVGLLSSFQRPSRTPRVEIALESSPDRRGVAKTTVCVKEGRLNYHLPPRCVKRRSRVNSRPPFHARDAGSTPTSLFRQAPGNFRKQPRFLSKFPSGRAFYFRFARPVKEETDSLSRPSVPFRLRGCAFYRCPKVVSSTGSTSCVFPDLAVIPAPWRCRPARAPPISVPGRAPRHPPPAPPCGLRGPPGGVAPGIRPSASDHVAFLVGTRESSR